MRARGGTPNNDRRAGRLWALSAQKRVAQISSGGDNDRMIPHSPSLLFLALQISLAAAVAQTTPPTSTTPTTAPTNAPPTSFLQFVKTRAADLRAKDAPPASLAEWNQQRAALRENLRSAWGAWPATPAPLEAKKLGELRRDGYRVEKIIFQTLPGVFMTANAYVPDKVGKLPTVLCVHGHWRGAKQDPVVQSRCIGLAKLGFFVLVVDAFGAGERGVGKALGEYHGEMTAATLFPVGLPLSGLQVYENMRAVDYLLTRPEVDGARLGLTGASGGGNQTMYAGAFDERFQAVVPTCSVGNYQAYLGAACCMCEVVPGALKFTEEWGLLAMVAPRALMVTSATKDAPQFSVGEAKKSLALAQPVFALHGKPENVKHAIFESPHAYNQPMREAMYGWMTKHLKGEGDGSPIPEPQFQTEDPEALRCFPGETRPDDWMTIPKFAAREAKRLLTANAKLPEQFLSDRPKLLAALEKSVLDVERPRSTNWQDALLYRPRPGSQTSEFVSEPEAFKPAANLGNFPIPASLQTIRIDSLGHHRALSYTLLFDLGESGDATTAQYEKDLHAGMWRTFRVHARSSSMFATPNDRIGRAPDHNSAEWAMWLGRPLLGQWVRDLMLAVNFQASEQGHGKNEATLVATGSAGVVALCAAALDPRITKLVVVGSLASYVTEVPYEKQRLGILAPGIVREVGDIAQLAALIAPRQVIIAGAVSAAGKPLTHAEAEAQFASTRAVYRQLGAESQFQVTTLTNAAEIARQFLK